VGFVLQYVELALLSRWSFEGRGDAVLRPSGKANENDSIAPNGVNKANGIVTGNGHFKPHGYAKIGGLAEYSVVTLSAKHPKLNDAKRIICATNLDRKEMYTGDDAMVALNKLYFGLTSTFSFRSVNTIYEVKNVPPFRDGKVPSTAWFLFQQVLITLLCILVVDASTAPPPPPNPAALFAPEKTRFFSRLDKITNEEMTLRVVSTAIYWTNMYAIMQGCVSVSAILMVSLGLSPVDSWRPFFGKWTDAYDLRRFWG
jgi:hypothetical protein